MVMTDVRNVTHHHLPSCCSTHETAKIIPSITLLFWILGDVIAHDMFYDYTSACEVTFSPASVRLSVRKQDYAKIYQAIFTKSVMFCKLSRSPSLTLLSLLATVY